jgi:hypothetical protein
MAAVEPVAELIQMPLDHTLMEEISSRVVNVLCEGAMLPLHRVNRNLEISAGVGCASRMSFRAGGSMVSVWVDLTRHLALQCSKDNKNLSKP